MHNILLFNIVRRRLNSNASATQEDMNVDLSSQAWEQFLPEAGASLAEIDVSGSGQNYTFEGSLLVVDVLTIGIPRWPKEIAK